MGKNLIPIIAKALGVEVGEEFAIKCHSKLKHRFKNDVLEFELSEGKWEPSGLRVTELKDVEVIKLPFEPKKGEKYWSYWGNWGIEDYLWDNKRTVAHLRKACGCVFRTEEEAIKARPAKYKELTGKEWGCDDG